MIQMMKTRTNPVGNAVLVVCLAGLLPSVLGGCIDEGVRKDIAENNSILAPLFKQNSPADAAAWAADPYDPDKRARGTLMLANAPFGGGEVYLALYREHLKDESSNVRAVSARALGMHGSPEDVPRLTPLLSAEDKSVRLEATRALQRLYNPVAVAPLVDRVMESKETAPEIRAEAASALGQYAEPKALQALIAALADPSLVVNRTAHDSLRTLTGQDDLPAERKPWVKWAKDTKAPFAGRREYVYPVFSRDTRWLDYVPFVGGPIPNEIAAKPVGFPDLEGSGQATLGAAGTSNQAR